MHQARRAPRSLPGRSRGAPERPRLGSAGPPPRAGLPQRAWKGLWPDSRTPGTLEEGDPSDAFPDTPRWCPAPQPRAAVPPIIGPRVRRGGGGPRSWRRQRRGRGCAASRLKLALPLPGTPQHGPQIFAASILASGAAAAAAGGAGRPACGVWSGHCGAADALAGPAPVPAPTRRLSPLAALPGARLSPWAVTQGVCGEGAAAPAPGRALEDSFPNPASSGHPPTPGLPVLLYSSVSVPLRL